LNALFGDGGFDTIQEALSSEVFGTTSFVLADNFLKAGTDTLTGFNDFELLGLKFADAIGYKLDASTFSQSIKLEGGDGPDAFVGSKFGDLLLGGGGSDSVDGYAGDDSVGGGPGDDKLAGGTGLDRLVETGDVGFKLTDTLLTGLGTDILGSFEVATLTGGAHDNVIDASAFKAGPVSLLGAGADDVLLGSAFGDLLRGGDGDDEIAAGRGDDRLFAEFGDDALEGGAGTDAGDGGPGADSCKSIETPIDCES
jgi:serralysin